MNTHVIRRDQYNMVVQKINEFGLEKQVGLYIMKLGADGKTYKAKIEWVETNVAVAMEPTIVERVGMFEKSSLEYAIQNAIPAPIKTSIEGKLEATERHLEDMRKIVFEIPTETTKEK